MSEFDEQNLANTAWAFAKANQRDEELFITLAHEVQRKVSTFNV